MSVIYSLLFSNRRISSMEVHHRKVLRCIFNGEIIWERSNAPYVRVKKQENFLSTYNNFTDDNQVYSNTNFKIK